MSSFKRFELWQVFLKNFLKHPSPPKCPILVFFIFFAVLIIAPLWFGFDKIYEHLPMVESFGQWYEYLLAGISGAFGAFLSNQTHTFIKKHHNEHNADKWLIANTVFGIATIYMVLLGIVFFN